MTATVTTFLNYDTADRAPIYPGTGEIYLHQYDSTETKIADARGKEKDFSLDRNGFAIHNHVTTVTDWKDADHMRSTAYPEAIELLKSKTGATRVIPVDHNVRVETWDAAVKFAEEHGQDEYVKFKVPARFVHVDQSAKGADTFLNDNVADRPLKTVYRDPLAVCDGSTFRDEDLESLGIILSNGKGSFKGVGSNSFELLIGKAAEGHQWWYMSEMQPDEVFFIRCFDSKMDGRIKRAPHSSFEDPRYKDREARQSCEIRCLVFWEDESAE